MRQLPFSMSRSKTWCFTDYNVDREPFNAHKDKLQYLVCGRETCPATGRIHIQGFVAFKIRTKLSTLRNWLPGAHFERAKGTPVEASEYCKKDGVYTEYGELPTCVSSSDKFKESINLARAGRLDDVAKNYPGLFLRYKRSLETCVRFTNVELDNSCGVWIQGPPRCGKDYSVRQLKSVFVKMLNKWWDGYNDERYVLISDVDQSCQWLGNFLKIWCDRYAFNAEIKGGVINIRPKKIFVTSNYDMSEIFDGKVLQALDARFTVYDWLNGRFVLRKRMESVPRTNVLKQILIHEDLPVEDIPSYDEVDAIQPPLRPDTQPSTSTSLPKKTKIASSVFESGSFNDDEKDFDIP